ncbi:TetR/AcrR family transcriptional regulator [Pseudonocardia endophytica]|uniref:TetR family transcriptional regulator n=1 Tax=Pseudonocardia endophytica TaxID=401976 RepID=A0A4R1HXR0_PSEEN|nr:TetR/AcrR family transcriptional regulator [Pseudonocardia endophytica]TCK27584.1 TetR family transcriptional regulator [Pseudonocardia endophytica]
MSTARRPRGRPAGTGAPAGRDRLLAAARTEFARAGLAGASIETITTAAGVGPPTLYHHFGNKAGLFVAVTNDVYSQVLKHFDTAVGDAADEDRPTFDRALDAVLRSSVPIMRSDPSLSAMIAVAQLEFRRDTQLAVSLRPIMRSFRAFFDDLAEQAPPELCPGPDDRRHLALALTTVITGLNAQALLLERPDSYVGIVDAMRRLVVGSVRQ